MKKSVLAIALAVLMAVSLLTVGAMADGTGSGTAADPYTTVDAYNKGIANGAKDGQDVYLTITGGSFTEGQFNLSNVQSSVNPPKLHLKITGATFTGNTAGDGTNSSFMYLPNCQELVIRNCTFDTGSTVLTYGINWNLIQIDGATVDISDCSFKGTYVENVIKLNQRNGEGDDADDVNFEGSFAATIAEAKISNIDIDSPVAVILLGSAAKGENGEAAPSTGAFPVTISNVTTTSRHGVVVFQAYLADSDAETAAKNALESGNLSGVSDYVKVMQAGDTLTKTANGDLGKAEDFVASIGTDYYTSLQSAIDAADNGDIINLLKSYDASSEGTITFDTGKKVTLDLGQNTLTLSRLNLTHGWLNVKNGSVSCTGQAFNVFAGPNPTEELYTKLVIERDAVVNAAFAVCLFPGSGYYGYSSSIEIYGKLESGGIFVSGNLGNDTTSATAIVNSGKIPTVYVYEGAVVNNSTEGQGISINGLANVTVNGGTITGSEAIGVKRGTLTVNGGMFYSNGEKVDPVEANHNGTENTGATISITSTYNYAGAIGVVINGGTFSSQNASAVYLGHSEETNSSSNIYEIGVSLDIKDGTFDSPVDVSAVYVADKAEGDATGYTKEVVSGGTFSSSVAEYVTDQLNYELNNNGTYSYYATAEEALADAAPGAEINGLGAAVTTNYTITVVYGNGMYPSEYTVPAGTEYTLPNVTNSGYIFLGWRDNNNVTHKADEVVTITADTTFTAVWGNLPDVKPSEPETPETPVFPFYDVTARDWYYSAVKYVYEKGLMDGVDVGVFAPNDTLTRAMVWTIIARAEGVDTTGGATWYAKAQEWVTAKGISDGENPNAAITRQELVTMLYRLAGEPAVSGTITAPDAASVSTWATNAMTWAMNIGLVEGDENGAVTPTATATRAQAAALIMRYLEA